MTFVEPSYDDDLVGLIKYKIPADKDEYIEIDSDSIEFVSINTKSSQVIGGSGPIITCTYDNQTQIHVLPERFSNVSSITELVILCQLENPHD